MVEVKKGKKYKLTAFYLVNGTDATISGSQVWTVSSDLGALEAQADGSAFVTALNVGELTVNYTAKGTNSAGEVPLFSSEILSIVEVVQEPVQVTINVEEVI